jgi:hypothetical protein
MTPLRPAFLCRRGLQCIRCRGFEPDRGASAAKEADNKPWRPAKKIIVAARQRSCQPLASNHLDDHRTPPIDALPKGSFYSALLERKAQS